MKKILFLFCLTIHCLLTDAQTPAPGTAQTKPIMITNITAHIGNGEVIENANISFHNGVITRVSTSPMADKMAYEIIDGTGKHAYPGFILPSTDLGLNEVAAVRASQDKAETGSIKPNVRSIIAYNTDSEIIPTLRFNGVLLAQITPVGGMISGSSSIVQLDAWNWEDALVKEDDGIHLNWPAKPFFREKPKPEQLKGYNKAITTLDETFEAAYRFFQGDNEQSNLKLKAMTGLFDGSKQLFVHVWKAKDIIRSVEFAKKHNVRKIVLVDAAEVLYVKEYLAENNIPVILNETHAMPYTTDSDIDESFKLPYELQKAGVKFCLGYSTEVMRTRNLPFIAGTAAAYGLPKEEALRAITLSTAEILGINEKLGSIEVGKQATFFISEGDALDMRSNKLTHAFIDGRKVTLEAMQQELYQKYKTKYGQ